MDEMKAVQTRLTPVEYEGLEARATVEDRSVAQCVRIAIREWVAKTETEKETAQ